MVARANTDICNMALLYSGVNQKIGSLAEASAAAQACNTIYDEMRRQILSEFRWPFSIKRKQLTPYTGNAYSATQNYNQGDMALFGANVYRSLLAANLGHQPDLDSSLPWWAQVTRDGWAFAAPLPDDALDPIACWEKQTVSAFATPPLYTLVTWQSSPNLRNPKASERVPFRIENANDGTDLPILLTDLDKPILQYAADISNPAVFPPMFVETFAWHLAGPLAIGLRGDEKKGAACKVMADKTLADAWVVAMRDQQEDEEPVSEFEAARGGSW